MLAVVALVVCVTVLAVLAARGLVLGARGYGWFLRDHYAQRQAPRFDGQCELIHCRKPVTPGSAFCSERHQADDEFINLG